jgi:hypothetical protein
VRRLSLLMVVAISLCYAEESIQIKLTRDNKENQRIVFRYGCESASGPSDYSERPHILRIFNNYREDMVIKRISIKTKDPLLATPGTAYISEVDFPLAPHIGTNGGRLYQVEIFAKVLESVDVVCYVQFSSGEKYRYSFSLPDVVE